MKSLHSSVKIAGLASALAVLTATGACAAAPGLLWTTNLGAQVFAVDGQTNVYANLGGAVLRFGAAGDLLSSNAICPLPGLARRDAAGNFFFAGTFDGTNDFGGVKLMGGWTNYNFSGKWMPGYPTCFLAKYSASGALVWVAGFGAQAESNSISDLLLDSAGGAYIGYFLPSSSGAVITRYSADGLAQWVYNLYADYSYGVTLGGLTSSNCAFFHLPSGTDSIAGGRIDLSGGVTSFSQSFLLGSDASVPRFSIKPVVDDSARVFEVGTCLKTSCYGRQILRKFPLAGSELWNVDAGAEVQWTLARDPQANVYLAGAAGSLFKYNTEGVLIWSNNFGACCLGMVVDSTGNRFLSFTNGAIARLQDDPASQAPEITGGLTPQTVFVGDAVSFSATATGTSPLYYIWLTNGVTIAQGTNTLTLTNVTARQAGNYSVIVTNAAGSATNGPVALRVKSVQFYIGTLMLTNGTYAFASSPTLTIRSAFTNGSIFYTDDGSTPTFASTPYSGPFTQTFSATLRAVGYAADFSHSEEADPIRLSLPSTYALSASCSGGGVLTTNPSPGCLALPADAVASWRADDDTLDFVGGHDGTGYLGLNYDTGIVGRAFSFANPDPTSDAHPHIWIPDSPELRFTNAMTVEAWIKPANRYGFTLVSKWPTGQAETCSYRFRLRFDGAVVFQASATGQGQDGSSGTCPTCAGSSAIPLNTWTHVAGTYDSANLRVYVNGVLDGQTPMTGSLYQSLNNVGLGATVGTSTAHNSSSVLGDGAFVGLMDEPALYRRALSGAELLAIYQAGAAGKCTTTNPMGIPFTGGTYPEASRVTVTALPSSGYRFLYWLGDAAGNSPTVSIPMNQDSAIRAIFGTTLSTTVAGSGQIQLSPAGGLYPFGSVVQLAAVPQTGNYFALWGNAATGNTNPLYFTVTNPNPTISSLFAALSSNQAALTVLINGPGHVDVSPRANAYSTNQTVTLTAVQDTGETFYCWSGGATGALNPLSVAMTQSRVIVANFAPRPVLRPATQGRGGWTSDGFHFTVCADPQAAWQIQVSTNLTSWQTIATVTNDTAEMDFLDPSATNLTHRFYRALPYP